MIKKCRSVNGLLNAISRHQPATLSVYSYGPQSQEFPGAWAVCGEAVTLNLGGGRFATISKQTFNRIKDRLSILS